MTRRADDGKRGRLLVAPGSLAEALSSAAIHVGAAGTTAVQAARVGIPAAVTAAVPNQVAQAAALERAQAVRALTRTQVAR